MQLNLGDGYWKDVYKKENIGIDGMTHNLIIPFIRLQWGYLEIEK